MTESHDEARLWPASPFDLADAHRCPSCFALVSAQVCPACGFALDDPRSPRVLELGRQMLTLELSRQQLIDRIRLAHATAAAAQTDAVAVALAPAPEFAAAGAAAETVVGDPVVAGHHAPTADTLTAPAPPPSTGAIAVVPASAETIGSTTAPVAVERVPAAESRTDFTSTSAAAPEGPVPPTISVPVTPSTTAPSGGGAGTAATTAVAASAPRRRLTVPVLLLIVGVSLVGVAAVFFLLLAWFVAGIAVRALIIGGITLATIVLASWLRRRDLGATAEAIGVLGVGFLALDAWAVRANDLFGTASIDAALYAGSAAIVVAAVCRLWARLSGLRGPDLAASLALPAGVGFLVGGLVDLPPAQAVTAGFLGAAAGGLTHALPAPLSAARRGPDGAPERLVLAVAGVTALIGAAVTAAVATGDAVGVVLWSSAGVALLGAAHAWAVRPRPEQAPLPGARIISGVASSLAVAAVGLAGWQLAIRVDEPLYSMLVGPVLAVAVAVALDLLRARRAVPTLLPAAVTAGVIGIASAAGAALMWLLQAQTAISAWTLWRTDPFLIPGAAPAAPLLALGTAVVIGGLMLLAPTLRRPLLREIRAVAIAVLLLAAAARTGVPAMLVGAALLIAVAAVVGAALARRTAKSVPAPAAASALPGEDPTARLSSARGGAGAGWSIAGALAAVTAFAAGTATPWLWLVGVAVAAAYPVALRLVLRASAAAAVALALAPVLVGVVAAIIAPAALGAAAGVTGSGQAVALVLLQWVALATLAVSAFARTDTPSRLGLAVAGYALTALTLVWTLVAAADDIATDAATAETVAAIGEPLLGIVRGIALLALLALIAFGRTRLDGHAVPAAAVLAAPAIAALAHAALDMSGTSGEDWATLVLAAGPAIVTVVAAIVTAARPPASRPPRPVPVGTAPAAPATAQASAAGASGASPLPAGGPDMTTWPPPAAGPGAASERPPLTAARPRTAADIGVLVTGLCVVWGIAPDLLWALLVIVAVAFGAASVTRGWAAPSAAEPADDRFATSRAGVPFADAPRRLLVWPAAVAAGAAWWAWLGAGTPGTDFTLESYAIPATVLFVGFAALLTWLRRRAEASVALGVGLVIGLVWPATAHWNLLGPQSALEQPLQGTLVILASAAVCLALSLTPLRGIRPPSVVGATVSLAALGLVAAERALPWQADAWPWPVAWLALLVAVAYASGLGMAAARPGRVSSYGYATVVPPIALAAASVFVLGAVDEGWVVAAALAILLAAHLASAALGRVPFARATRWTSLIAALAVAGVAAVFGGAREVEFATLPIAAAVAAGAALAVRRRRRAEAAWPAGEELVWCGALVLATVPSLLAPAEPARTWLLIGIALIGAAAIALTPIPDAWRVRVPSALILTGAALAMAIRVLVIPWLEFAEAAAITAAVGAVGVAVILTATAVTLAEARLAAVLAGAGVALLAATVVLRSGDDTAIVATTVAIAGAVGVVGASSLGLRRWSALGAVLAVGGLVVVAVGCGIRFLAVVDEPGFEADLWAAAGAAIAVAIGVAALRASASRRVAVTVGAGLAAAAVLFATAELLLLGSASGFEELRTVLTMSLLSAAAYVGAVARTRLGAAPAVVVAIAAGVFGVLAFFVIGVTPVELVTVPAALAGLAYGARTLALRPESRTWPALGPWLGLLLLPSLAYDFFGEAELWRIVALGVVAVGLVIVGAARKLQAPLVLGSAVVLVHGVAQLWPWISTSYVAVPWWLWLGIGGAVLIFIAARYERRVKQLRAAITAVTSLR
ncbi:SCO7613 C-terminal domain-containing membrane protein [Microbacterium ureisolvens]|uniref:SCO7613 C-terminal domain-containing membrane protein n=1 Tax=Microbacterium ureisolvens TaxID=2781186 RepID=UPI00363B5843